MADIRVAYLIWTYERRFNSKPHVCSTTFGCSTLGANGVLSKLFLAFLISDSYVGVSFLNDVGLVRSSMVCCKYGSQMSWSIDTNCKNVYQWRYRRITSASECSAPTPVRHGYGCSREFHEGFVLNVRRRSLIRTRSRARGGMWRHSSIPTTSITWGCDPTTWTSSPNSSASLHACTGALNDVWERSCHYVTLRRFTPHFNPVASRSSSGFGVHITTDDVAPSFVVGHMPLKVRTTTPLSTGNPAYGWNCNRWSVLQWNHGSHRSASVFVVCDYGVRVARVRINHVLKTWKQMMNSGSVRIVIFVVSRLVNMYILVQ